MPSRINDVRERNQQLHADHRDIRHLDELYDSKIKDDDF